MDYTYRYFESKGIRLGHTRLKKMAWFLGGNGVGTRHLLGGSAVVNRAFRGGYRKLTAN